LRLFIEIAETSDYRKLIKRGEPTDEQCSEVWEEIVQRNGLNSGNHGYSNYLNDAQTYGGLLSEYLFMRSALTKLLYVIDYQLIKTCESLFGYTFALDSSESYAQSLFSVSRRVDSLATRIKMHQNKMRAQAEVSKSGGSSFNEALAVLIDAFKVDFRDDITLAKYNELVKILKQRNRGNRT
jgi:hypothetical protein